MQNMTTVSPSIHADGLWNENSNVEKTKHIVHSIKHKLVKKDAARTIFIGLVTSIAGLAILFIQPHLYYRPYSTTMPEGSRNFEMWRKPRSPLFSTIHIFNITNADAFLEGNEKLKFEDVGPFTYREIYEQQNVQFDKENGTVTTHPLIVLEKIMSDEEDKENETVVVPNIALLGLGNKVTNFLTKLSFNALVMQTCSKPIITRTAKDYMFGYDDPLITLAHNVFPSWIFFKKLGIIDRILDMEDDTLTTYTGEKDQYRTGTLAKYNGLPKIPFWQTPCDKLEGASNGFKFQNNIEFNETLYLHYKIFCRTLALVPVSGIQISDEGLPVIHYKIADNAFDYGEKNEDNKCFCKRGICPTKGTTDVSDCFYGFAITVSHPHFYNSDPTLLDSIEGLKPHSKEHESYFYINPETGAVVRFCLRIQMNLVLGDLTGVGGADKFFNLTIPLAWAQLANPSLDTTTAVLLFLLLRVNPVVERIIAIMLLLTGVLCFASLKVPFRRVFPQKNVTNKLKFKEVDHEEYANFIKKPEMNSKKNMNQPKPLLPP